MPGLREAGLVGASLAVTGGLVYAVWSYVQSPTRRSDPDHHNKPIAAEITRQQHAAETETRGADDQPSGGGGDHQPEPEPEEQQHHGPPGDEGGVLLQQEQEAVVVEAVTAHVNTSSSSEPEAAVVVESRPVDLGKQVLVLGLDGAGKTSLLHCFSTGALEQDVVPTNGFNAVSINREDLKIEFLEIGGREDLRAYWQKYLPRALVLVFVVDSNNKENFPLARKHLHELLSGAHPQLPLVVLSNKVDLPGACSITELHENLSLCDVGDQRRLYLIGTSSAQSADNTELNSGVQDARDLIVQLVCEG